MSCQQYSAHVPSLCLEQLYTWIHGGESCPVWPLTPNYSPTASLQWLFLSPLTIRYCITRAACKGTGDSVSPKGNLISFCGSYLPTFHHTSFITRQRSWLFQLSKAPQYQAHRLQSVFLERLFFFFFFFFTFPVFKTSLTVSVSTLSRVLIKTARCSPKNRCLHVFLLCLWKTQMIWVSSHYGLQLNKICPYCIITVANFPALDKCDFSALHPPSPR